MRPPENIAAPGASPDAAHTQAHYAEKHTREAWLMRAVDHFRPTFSFLGFPLPSRIRVSCGFPSRGGRGKVRGETWSPRNSSDGTSEIFISPFEDESTRVLGILAHELTHQAVGLECGHRGNFVRVARALGLEGKMTATTEGAAFKRLIEQFPLPAYPHASLSGIVDPEKQSTRLLKVECRACRCVARVARKWLEDQSPACWQFDCQRYGLRMEVNP